MRDTFKDFESPFFDPKREVLELEHELHGDPALVLKQSPFGQFSLELDEVFETRHAFNLKPGYLEIVGESGSAGIDESEEEDSERWNEPEFDSDGAEELESLTDDEEQHSELVAESLSGIDDEADDETAVDEECASQEEEEVEFDQEEPLDPADTVDQAAAQSAFPKAVRDRIEPLLAAGAVAAAAKWNREQHPQKSGISLTTLRASLDNYLDSGSVEQAMRNSTELNGLASDSETVFAVLVHQFQQKIYKALPKQQHGQAGEGTLDALGFVRHRHDSLNSMDLLNRRFHTGMDGKSKSKAFQRVEEAYRKDPNVLSSLGADVSPKTWYSLFVYAPFLGRPILKGVHVELMRRLRLAEKWLLAQRRYQNMSPVELGAALGIDEDHHGGRSKNNASMHTLGLAIDIGYIKNPWVAGQSEAPMRNSYFQDVTRNASRLLSGTDETVTPKWLYAFGSDPSRTTESAHNEIEQRHTQLQVYLSLQNDPAGLKTTIQRRSHGVKPELVIGPEETVDAAVKRWAGIIKNDRARLQHALGSGRKPANGFLNFHSDLAVALRDHGCLAWGAIDLGGKQSGDMMHFDCRATGVGWSLALDIQRTVGAGHPCSSKGKARANAQTSAAHSGTAPAGSLGGSGWTFNATTLPMRVAIYCPRAAKSLDKVDVLVFVHGFLGPCPPVPKKAPDDLVTKAPFELGKIVDASRRGIVLVVPFMDWSNLDKDGLGFGPISAKTEKPIYHALGKPANLNGILREVLAEVARHQGKPTTSLSRLILAGHSRAYGVLDPLAKAHADTEMSRTNGALSRLSYVWALDTTYTAPTTDWIKWLQAKSPLEVEVFYRTQDIVRVKETNKAKVVVARTNAGGLAFEGAVKSVGKRLRVTRVLLPESHCDVPSKRLPGLLAGLPQGSISSASSRELEESQSYETFHPIDASTEEFDEEGLDEEGLDEEDLDS